MRKIFPKAMAGTGRLAIIFAISGLLWGFTPGQASAGFCSATKCSLTLTNNNFAGTGTFGTVTLALMSHVVRIDVNLTNGYRIIVGGKGKGNSPGAIGFADNVGGNLTISNFQSGGISTSFYQGSQSWASGCTANDCHWAPFGYANNAVAMSGPPNSQSLQDLSFSVSQGTSIADVHQLLQKFVPSGNNPSAYFVVDACRWDLKKSACGPTGLLSVTQAPEPGTLALLASGLLALAFLRWKRVI